MSNVELKVGKVVNVTTPKEYSIDNKVHVRKEYIVGIENISKNELSITSYAYESSPNNKNINQSDVYFLVRTVLTDGEFKRRHKGRPISHILSDNYSWYSNARLTGEMGKALKLRAESYLMGKNAWNKGTTKNTVKDNPTVQIPNTPLSRETKEKIKAINDIFYAHGLTNEQGDLEKLIHTKAAPELVKRGYLPSYDGVPLVDELGEKVYKRYLQLSKELDIPTTDYFYFE